MRPLTWIACIVCWALWGAGCACGQDWHQLVASRQLIDLRTLDSTILIDLRYATRANCVGQALYPADFPCLLRPETAVRLHLAQLYLRAHGYGLKVWDAYRPPEAQRTLWSKFARRGYVANPDEGKGSLHTWGIAVDVTLVGADGSEQPMPSGFDVFTPAASGIYRGHDARVQYDLHMLHLGMKAGGFVGLTTEWWHYSPKDWYLYEAFQPSKS